MNDRSAIIIPLDGSETATVAMGAAQAMASIMDAVLYIVHVTEEPLSEDELLKKLKIGRIEIKDFSLHQIVSADVVDGILRFAAGINTEMIVMSSHGWTYDTRELLGGTTTGIVQRSINPVMIIRPDIKVIPDAKWRPTKMLVPQDGTPTAAAAMTQVFRLAKLMKAEVDVLSIGIVGPRPTEAGAMPPPRYVDHARYDWPAWALEFKERFLAEKPPEVKMRLSEREGDPAEVMVNFAAEREDDFIALGWHGHLEEERAAIVKKLLQIVDRPVLLIWSRE